MKKRCSDCLSKVNGLTFGTRQLCIVYFVVILASDLWNGIHTATVLDERIGSQVTAAWHVNTIEPLPFIALQTSGDDGGLPLTSSQDEVGRTQKITHTVDQPLQLTHQTDIITSSSTTTSQTTTDELDPATEPHIIDLTTAHDELFYTSSTEEILGSDTSAPPHTSRAPGHKIPCTPEESKIARCLNGGECSSVQTSNTSRTLLCGCTSDWTGARCEIRYLDPSYWESRERAKKIGISVGVVVPVIIIIIVLVVVMRRRRKAKAKTVESNNDPEIVQPRTNNQNGANRSFTPVEILPLNNNCPSAANGNTNGESGGLLSRESVEYNADRSLPTMESFLNGGTHTHPPLR